MDVYKLIYQRLQTLGILDENGAMNSSYKRYASDGLMDLHVDCLLNNTISLAHNGKQNGDIMADPDVEVRIYPENKTAEALTFQNDYLGIYQEVYPDPGLVKLQLKKELNDFLNDWLQNMIDSQYELVEEE